MNIYADRGNIIFLQRRCEWRGIGFSYAASGPGERFDPGAHDLSTSAAARTATSCSSPRTWSRPSAQALAAAVEDGAVVLAVCGGYQLLGHGYQLGDERIAGLGLADLETVREPGPRLIGNVRSRSTSATAHGCSPGSRTTAGAPTSATAPTARAACSAATATTARTASRECGG